MAGPSLCSGTPTAGRTFGAGPLEPVACEQALGNSLAACGVMTGPGGACAVFMTTALIIAPATLAHVFVFPAHEGKEVVGHSVGAVLLVVSLAFFCRTALSDPGILPRLRAFQNAYDAARGEYRSRPPPRVIDIVHNGLPCRLKWCPTCNIYRPPRTVHCRTCDNCVEKFDHHCPWVGTCIGIRNYRSFYGFVFFVSLLCFWTIGHSIELLSDRWHSMATDADVFQLLSENVLVTCLIAYVMVAACFTSALLVFHTYLILVGQTTYESLTSVEHGNPFFIGFLANFIAVLCVSPRPVFFDLRTKKVRWPPPGVPKLKLMNIPKPQDLSFAAECGAANVANPGPSQV